MTTKRLGKGLGALIRPLEKQDTLPAGVTKIPISKVKMNPHQPRKTFDEKALRELEASIREKGCNHTHYCTSRWGLVYLDSGRKTIASIQTGKEKRNSRIYHRSY